MYLYIFEDGDLRLSADRAPTPDDIDSIADGVLTVLEISGRSRDALAESEIEIRVFDHDSKLYNIEDLRTPI